ncbi:hypothetical protein COO60DRAFT_1473124 [Scenedesmus sp. NREL 46B-D3]|nr:hypothetical protein COO60DRAFT_1473124 [Scenedesmus sp. NREL 46B-D3]
MVRIIDGEIVQDNDPRLQARQRPSASRPQQGQQQHGFTNFTVGRPQMAAQQAAPAGGLDWSAPPFKAIPNEYGSMLPDVELYGLRVPGVGLVAVAALGMFFGWRGLLGGLIFGYLYLTYGQAAVAAAGHGRPASGTGAGAAAGGDGFMQQAFGGMMGGGGAEADGPGHAAAGAAARPAGVWMGKGRKLGSN